MFFITQVLNELFDCAYFFKLNFKNTYYRIQIRENDKRKTTFRIRYEHFKYMIMSFELTNASVIFQIYINKTLIDIVDIFYVIYFDDILIFSKNRITHVNHVKKVLRRLKKFDLYVNLKKCEFFVKKIEYLNFIMHVDDIKMSFRRINIIRK